MSHKNSTEDINKGAAILLLGTILSKLIGAFFKIPLSSNAVLGDLGFGYFSSVYDLYTPVYMLALNGFPVAISKIVADYVANNRFSDVKSVFKISKKTFLSFAFICLVLLLLISFPLASITDKTGKVFYCFIAALPSVLFCMASAVYRGYFEGLNNMTPTAISTVIEALGKLLLGLGFAYATVRLSGDYALSAAMALLGITVGNLISAIYLHICSKNKKHLNFNADALENSLSDSYKKIRNLLISVTVPIVLSALSGSVIGLIDSLLVRIQLTSYSQDAFSVLEDMYQSVIKEQSALIGESIGNASLPTVLYGIRSKAYTVFNIVPTFTVAIGVSAIPVLTDAFSNNDKKRLITSLNSAFKLSSLIAFPAGFGIIALSGRIMALLYGKGASAEIGGKMLFIYGIAAIFAGLAVTLGCILQALNKEKTALLNVFIGLVIKVILNLTLCTNPDINIFGAVFSTAVCYLIMVLLHIFTIVKYIAKPDLISVFLKPLSSAFVCGAVAYGISNIGDSSFVTVLSIIGGGVSYIAVLLLIKTFTYDDIIALPKGEKLLNLCFKLKIIKK